jgi:hypothetical protein
MKWLIRLFARPAKENKMQFDTAEAAAKYMTDSLFAGYPVLIKPSQIKGVKHE